MRGILLAGGKGTRLWPLTKTTNKHMIAVYNQPMAYWPMMTLKKSGIKDILLVSSRDHVGGFLNYFGSGKEFGVKLTYDIQEEASGIAGALGVARDFIGKDKNMAVVLGDNIFKESFAEDIRSFSKGAKVFLKRMANPEAYGVAIINKKDKTKIKKIVEKPKIKVGDKVVTGLYLYDNQVFDIIDELKPSRRGEFEITDVNNWYIKRGEMNYRILEDLWADAGENHNSLLRASNLVAEYIVKKEN
jgi:glucose-1-phosphate thymidylyltransferase